MNEHHKQARVSRRRFLGLAALGGGMALLAACAPATPAAPTAAPAPPKPQPTTPAAAPAPTAPTGAAPTVAPTVVSKPAAPAAAVTTASAAAGRPQPASGELAENPSLTLAYQQEPDSLDINSSNWVHFGFLWETILAGPFHQGPDWSKAAQPDLVERFESNPDATLWRLKFRDDAKFSDGAPITSDDVKFSWDHVSVFRDKADAEEHGYVFRPWGPQGQITHYGVKGWDDAFVGKSAKELVGVKVKDPTTIELEMSVPQPNLPDRFGGLTARIIQKANAQSSTRDNPYWKHYVTSGAYRMVDYRPNERISLEPNQYYFGAKPWIQKLTFRVAPDPSVAMIAYQNNEIDVVRPSGAQLLSLLAERNPELQLLDAKADTNLIRITPYPPTDDVHVRRALIMATDRDTLCNKVLTGMWTPQATRLWPAAEGYERMLPKIKPLAYDPAAARQELLKSKYGPDVSKYPPIRFFFARSSAAPDVVKYGEALMQMWQDALGVRVIIEEKAFEAESLERANNVWMNNQNMFNRDPGGSATTEISGLYSQRNDYSAKNNTLATVDMGDEFAKLPYEADQAIDLDKRWDIYARWEQIAIDNAAWIPIGSSKIFALVKPWVKNWKITPQTYAWEIRNAWVAKH